MLQECASAVAALDMGFLPGLGTSTASPTFVYNLGADDFDDSEVPSDAFVVYQGHHGDKGALCANVILPGAAYTEKAGTYVNLEGRMQQTRAAASTPGDARDDWKIIRAVSEIVGSRLPYDTLDEVQERLEAVSPTFGRSRLNRVQPGVFWLNGEYSKTLKGRVRAGTLATSVKMHFMSDAISRASPTMARVTRARLSEGLSA
jgi:NADH dehydrogenase (ubiquinone) Fe-S protein 1